jgi:signal peptidase I
MFSSRAWRISRFLFPALIVSTILLAIALTVTGLICLVTTSTNSMGEAFPNGALGIFVRQSSYTVNDVVLFKVHGCLVAHRIVAETERGFKTKGDNSRSVDPWVVPLDAVKGKMLFAVPHVGSVIMLMRAPEVFAGVATVIFASLTWRDLLGEWRFPLLRKPTRSVAHT